MHYIFIYFIPHIVADLILTNCMNISIAISRSPPNATRDHLRNPTSPASHAVPCLIAELNNMLSWVSGLLSIIENE